MDDVVLWYMLDPFSFLQKVAQLVLRVFDLRPPGDDRDDLLHGPDVAAGLPALGPLLHCAGALTREPAALPVGNAGSGNINAPLNLWENESSLGIILSALHEQALRYDFQFKLVGSGYHSSIAFTCVFAARLSKTSDIWLLDTSFP